MVARQARRRLEGGHDPHHLGEDLSRKENGDGGEKRRMGGEKFCGEALGPTFRSRASAKALRSNVMQTQTRFSRSACSVAPWPVNFLSRPDV
jgi:hypothetical protein